MVVVVMMVMMNTLQTSHRSKQENHGTENSKTPHDGVTLSYPTFFSICLSDMDVHPVP